jgi:hypothetical protein
MKRAILGAYLCTLMIAGSYAQSVQGSDWLFNMSGSIFIPSLGVTLSVSVSGQPVSITQSGNSFDDGFNDFQAPLNIPPLANHYFGWRLLHNRRESGNQD